MKKLFDQGLLSQLYIENSEKTCTLKMSIASKENLYILIINNFRSVVTKKIFQTCGILWKEII